MVQVHVAPPCNDINVIACIPLTNWKGILKRGIEGKLGTWLSRLKRCPHMAEIEGSNPSVPTKFRLYLR